MGKHVIIAKKLANEALRSKYEETLRNLHEKNSFKDINYDPLVRYSVNEFNYSGACFINIFKNTMKKDSVVLVDLFYGNDKRLLTTYTNINKYLKLLNGLYSFVDISLVAKPNQGLYAKIVFKEESHYLIVGDVLTRIRYLFEGPFCGFMNRQLNRKDFSLNSFDATIAKEIDAGKCGYFINTHHAHFDSAASWKKNSYNPIDYDNYEKNVMAEIKKGPPGSLHSLINKLVE